MKALNGSQNHSAPSVGRLLVDCSLSLINKTGAHFIAQDLRSLLSGEAVVRQWRVLGAPLPSDFQRRVLGRLMLSELKLLEDLPMLTWPEPESCSRRLLLDPLYVLRSQLDENDIVLCHDVGPLSHPNLYDVTTCKLYTKAYKKIQAVGPSMVYVSNTSYQEFLRHCPGSYRQHVVVPLYLRNETINGPEEPVPGVSLPFFLTVGALEGRKNHLAALKGFQESRLAEQGFQFIVCGSRGDQKDEVELAVANVQGATLLGYVSDAQLRWLYRNASAFVLMSLLEGFGMPALEAAAHGLLPIVSGDSALAEATGGLSFTADPHSPTSIAETLIQVAHLPPSEREARADALRAHSSLLTQSVFRQRWRDLLAGHAQQQTQRYGD